MRIFYLPVSSVQLSTPELLRAMRKWHWQRYWQLLAYDIPKAKEHRTLAESIEAHEQKIK